MSEVEQQAREWRENSPHLNQRDLGRRLGVTSHVVGRLLNDLGLRENSRPTPEAFDNGMVVTERSGDWPQYRWNERRIVPLLRDKLNKTPE